MTYFCKSPCYCTETQLHKPRQEPPSSSKKSQSQMESEETKRRSCRNSAQLPTELIIEILVRLQVKPLLQFRSVSKSWLALISSPEFIKAHLNLSAKNKGYAHHRVVLTHQRPVFSLSFQSQCDLKDCSLSSLLNKPVTEASDLDYPMIDSQKSVWIVGSVNGLICLAIGKTNLFLWNPSIRKFKKLPDLGCDLDGYRSIKYGFGYDESHDDYKVVILCCVYRYSSLHQVEVKIYSLKSDSWRSKDDFEGVVRFIRPGKFVNGKLHWANNASRGRDGSIISIDLADEKWGNVELPSYGEGDIYLLLEVLRSDLSLICNYRKSHADIWIMKEYGLRESWTKMCTIKYCSDPEKNLISLFVSPTLCLSNKGEILLLSGSNFMVYNPKDKSIRYQKVADICFCSAADIYIESLVCPLL